MKIGIITHHYINNYGAFLQGYALQNTIKKLFPNDEIYMVHYINRKHDIINTGGCFRFHPKKDSIKSYFQKIQWPRTFNHAIKEFMNLTKSVKNEKEINELGLDCIIIGSDEVWHYQSNAADTVKFALHLNAKKIIAYAPSVGGIDLKRPIPSYVTEGLKRFTAISARDELTEKLVETVLGYRPQRVLDPTLLYDFPVYENEFTKKLKERKYILMYYCDKIPEEYKTKICEIAEKKGYEILGAGEYKKWFTDITVNVSPFEWIEMFRNAQFVFTGTFHGSVFSLITNTNFAAYLTNPSRIKKVSSLLEQLNLSNRIIKENEGERIKELFDETINYNIVNDRIRDMRKSSLEYLCESLKNK